MADKAVEFIRDAKVIDPDKPFFMYLAPQAGHAPHLVPLEWADRYKGLFDEGYEAIRAGILRRQIELGLLPEGTELSPINPHGEPERTGPDGQPWPLLDTVRPWDTLSDDEKRLFARMAEVFAGYISYYDDRLGQVLDYLEESGQLDNTIIVVVSDNGASGEGGPNGSFNEWRFFNGVPDTTETTLPHIDELGTPASNNHYNTGWAWALDTPFPYWKRWAGAEGGVADMCIVSWPAQIQASTEIRHQYVHAVDVVPTIYDLLGIEPPEVLKGYPQNPIEGESFAAALTDPTVPGKPTQFYTMLGQRSIYHEGWLASTVHPPLSGWGNFEHDEWELFHLETDRSQTTNVAADQPERLEQLKGLWFYYAGLYNGLPLDDRTALEQVLAERPRRRAPTATGTSSTRTAPTSPSRPGPRSPAARTRSPPGSRSTRADVEGVDLGGRRRARRPQPLRQGRAAPLHVQLDRHHAPGRRRRPRPDRRRPRAAPPSSWPRARAPDPDMPGTAGTLTLYVDDEAVGSGRDRHPARLLLPHRRRHLRRAATAPRPSRPSTRRRSRSPAARSTRSWSTSPASATSTTKPRSAPGSRSTDRRCGARPNGKRGRREGSADHAGPMEIRLLVTS